MCDVSDTIPPVLTETLDVFEGATPLTTSEVAEALSVSRRSAYDRLDRLVDRGAVETKKVGARGRVWWRPPAVTDRTAVDAAGDTGPTRDQLASLVDNVPGMVYRCGAEPPWEMSYVSEGCREVTGYEPEALASGDVSYGSDVVHPADHDRLAEEVATGLAENSRFTTQYRIRDPDGETRWVWERGYGVDPGEDGYDSIEGVITDVTEQQATQRRLRRERAFTDSLFDAQADILYAFDADGTLRRWNERLPEVTGYDDAELAEMEPQDFVAAEAREAVAEEMAVVLGEGETRTMELPLLTADGETIPYEYTGAPIYDDSGQITGFTGVGRDISDRRERERELRGQRDFTNHLLETVPSAIIVYDADGRIVRANERAIERLGLVPTEDGTHALGDVEVQDDRGDPIPESAWPYNQVLETGTTVEDWHAQIDLPEEGRRWISVNAKPVRNPDDETEQVIVTSSDVTRLKRQADQLARERDDLAAELDEVYARVDDAFYAVDEEFRFTYLNDRAEELLGHAEADLLGEVAWEAFPEARDTVVWDAFHEAMETQEPGVFEMFYAPLDFWVEARVYPSESGLSVYFRDVTERKERERELERYERIVENLPVGVYRNRPGLKGEFVEANPALADILGVDAVTDVLDHYVSEFYEDPADREAFSDRVLDEGIVRDVEQRQRRPNGEEFWISVTAIATEEDGETYFDGIVRDVTEEKERERKLERQRERLAALNNLNAVVRDVNEALVRKDSRAEIETAVCDRLADSDSYVAAWMGGVDPRSETVESRVGAGGPLSETAAAVQFGTSALDLADEAIQTRSLQVVTDLSVGEWDGFAVDHDVAAVAAIPVVHEETVYGVLTVYADREGAFADEERAVIGQVGELVGHAIAAVERKQALMSDTVVELEFLVEDAVGDSAADATLSGHAELTETVPVGGGAYLAYGHGSPDAVEMLDSLTDSLPSWESLTVYGSKDDADVLQYELRLSNPPVLSSLAAYGGYLDRARYDAGDYHLTVHLPLSADPRRLIEVVEEAYPGAEMVARRQVTREPLQKRVERVIQEDLTDRQRAALEASYHAGFFEWPRESDGESVADSLGISSPTFHQHLRAAERKLLAAILS
ncbi:PAS domain S-box protein [Halobacteriales archaeon Cl-PHB]